MADKIKVDKPLVILHGDEMAQVAFERILEQFVVNKLDITLLEIDLSAEHRLLTNGDAVRDAVSALKTHGVGIKNAGMTVNRDQLEALLAKHPHIKEATLDKLATKSPNGAIRKGISGNITREDIQFRNIEVSTPEWIDRDIVVDTMDSGGNLDSHNELSKATGIVKLMFVGSSGDPIELHRRKINIGDPWLLATNDLAEVQAWARRFFKRALDENRDVYLGLKDTVIAGYDGVMRAAIEFIFGNEFKDKFEQQGLANHLVVFEDTASGDGLVRLYRRGPKSSLDVWTSEDGVHFTAPDLGREYQGAQNVVLEDPVGLGTIFLDPNAPPEERIKYFSSYRGRVC